MTQIYPESRGTEPAVLFIQAGDAVVAPNAAHLPSLEKPEAFNAVLRGFLDVL